MAFSCGFYNSVNHDRVYDAVQFGEMFDGLINDGVYATVGNAMAVTVVSGMTIRVRSGRAWFNKTWSVNTNDYPLTLPDADLLLPRIDAVVLEVDTRLQTRNNSLKIISGYPASNPSKPTLIRANGLYQYPLAWVTVPANARSIVSGNIEIQVGRSPTPYVTGVVSSVDITQLYNSWEKEFRDWFDDIKGSLGNGGGSSGNLLDLTNRVITLEGQVKNIPEEASFSEMQYVSDEIGAGSGIITSKHYISPFMLKNWWNLNTMNYDGSNHPGALADSAAVKAGTSKFQYISPATLKSAFPELYDGTSGGGSSVKKGNIEISGSSSISLNTSFYRQIGNLVICNIRITTTFTANSSNIFTLNGLPTFTDSMVFPGILMSYQESQPASVVDCMIQGNISSLMVSRVTTSGQCDLHANVVYTIT